MAKLGNVTTEQRASIRDLVCDVLDVEESAVQDGDNFREVFGADSMGALEILSGIERELGIVIEQSKLARLTDLNSVYQVVDESIVGE